MAILGEVYRNAVSCQSPLLSEVSARRLMILILDAVILEEDITSAVDALLSHFFEFHKSAW